MAVVKISDRGQDPGGMVRYLFGKGRSNEHTNQRTVAGTCEYARAGDQAAIKQAHCDLRAYSQANPQVNIKGGYVWQASITLPPGDAPLSDDKWKAIADDYMHGMGFADPAKSPVRWTAVNHGLNTSGSDHIHIVMSMVREDGSRVSIHNDAIESSKLMKQLEQTHGLTQLQGRGQGTAQRTFTGGEKGKAFDGGHEIERVEIERIVRGTATASGTEAEFVRRLRAAGMEVRPRVSGDVVTGYSIGMPGTNVHFAGGKIARDLTLPRLRQRWAEQPAGTEAAALEWIHGSKDKPLVTTGRETRTIPVTPAAVTKELDAVKESISAASTLELREIGQDLSGALALGARSDPSLAKPARDAGRWAQTRSYAGRPKQHLMNTGLLILQASDPLSPMGQAIMLKQVLSTLRTLHEFHQARCQVAFGRSNTMSHPAPDDGIGETLEGVAMVGVTVGAQAVQKALYNRQTSTEKSVLSPQMNTALGRERDRVRAEALKQSKANGGRGWSVAEERNSQLKLLADAAGVTADPDFQRMGAYQQERVLIGLENKVGADRAKGLLHANGLPFIEEVHTGRTNITGDDVKHLYHQPPTKELVAAGAPRRNSWESEPMSLRQKVAVQSYARNAGLDADRDLDGFAGWTKADASAAIGEFQKSRVSGLDTTKVKLTPDAQTRFDPTKIKPRTTATRPGAGPIQGDDIRNPKGRGR